MIDDMRIALAIEYDGSAFCGWQIQANVPTVQASVESAISQMAGHSVRVHAAGRTDTGVHASKQIIHFDTKVVRPLSAWVNGVNNYLPSSIRVLWAEETDAQFHARFSATARHYRYILHQHRIRPALLSGKVGWVHYDIDFESMLSATQYLLGEHDFSSFRAAECQAISAVKTLHKLSIQQEGQLFIFDFSANAFLHNMVRNMIGLLLHIGRKKADAKWAKTVLEYRSREKAPPTFMPDGLYLSGVSYPERYKLDTDPIFRYGYW